MSSLSFSRLVFKFVRMMQRETSPFQLSLGVTLGILIAFSPAFTLQWFLLLIAVLVVRMNIAALASAFVVFFPLAKLLTPASHWVGSTALTRTPALKNIWAAFFHAPLIPFTYFYNSVVLGNIFFGVIIALPTFVILHVWLNKHRERLARKVKDSRTWKRYISSRIYRRNVR